VKARANFIGKPGGDRGRGHYRERSRRVEQSRYVGRLRDKKARRWEGRSFSLELSEGGNGDELVKGVYSEAFFCSRRHAARERFGRARQCWPLSAGMRRKVKRTLLLRFSAPAGVDDGTSSAAFLLFDAGFDFLAGGGLGALGSAGTEPGGDD
jgi:hypothetical protein